MSQGDSTQVIDSKGQRFSMTKHAGNRINARRLPQTAIGAVLRYGWVVREHSLLEKEDALKTREAEVQSAEKNVESRVQEQLRLYRTT
jgi:hypothetical protein